MFVGSYSEECPERGKCYPPPTTPREKKLRCHADLGASQLAEH